MKIQYPGVAESIPSDIANLSRFIRVMGIALLSHYHKEFFLPNQSIVVYKYRIYPPKYVQRLG